MNGGEGEKSKEAKRQFYESVGRKAQEVRSTLVEGMRPLAQDFEPGPFDVICARGRHAKLHSGNLRYKQVIELNLPRYNKAKTKADKSLVVSSIVDSVREASPNGGFVKKENDSWYEVGDRAAREKVGQGLRDLLHTKYKSSTKAKKARRRERKEALSLESDPWLVPASALTLAIMDGPSSSEDESDDFEARLRQTNSQLLSDIRNESLQSEDKYHEDEDGDDDMDQKPAATSTNARMVPVFEGAESDLKVGRSPSAGRNPSLRQLSLSAFDSILVDEKSSVREESGSDDDDDLDHMPGFPV